MIIANSRQRYYYLPDIETYYDLSLHEFIYLDNGQWYFSGVFPSIYTGFDLSNCFVVALNLNVYQPWMHHQYYISHYPRYYYQNRYYDKGIRDVRGFNENVRKPFYWKEDEKRNREWLKDDGTPARPNIINKDNDNQGRRPQSSREPQSPNYYGKEIGSPVKVERQMREQKPIQPRSNENRNPVNKGEGEGRGGRR